MSETARPALKAFPDRKTLALAATDRIVAALEDRLDEGGRATFVASGGSTPTPVYQQLRDRPIDWGRVDVTLSDERWVAPTSPESNERMLREQLLQGRAAAAKFTPLYCPAGDASTSADVAEAIVEDLMPFDSVLLGMGDDGHFASLFPGSSALSDALDLETVRRCIGVPAAVPAPPQPRISLTLKAIVDSRLILLLITGEEKKAVLDRALAGADLPVRALLMQERAPVHIYWAP
jgi:6-phosphogluconolactonase